MANISLADVVTNPMASAQTAMLYGPQTQQALRRSQYLADALKQINTEGSQNIHSAGELGAKLLATAILSRSNDKSQDALLKAIQGDQDAESQRVLGPITAGLTPPSAAPPAAEPQPQPQPQPAPTLAPPPQASLDPHQLWRDFVLPHEGGLNPADMNGSPTNYGINQRANPQVDVRHLTPDQAGDIFTNKYFAPAGAANLPPALAAVHGDTTFINPTRAQQFLQAAGGDPGKYMDLREAWMAHQLQTNPAAAPYAHAWTRRNADLRAYAANLGGLPPAPPNDNGPSVQAAAQPLSVPGVSSPSAGGTAPAGSLPQAMPAGATPQAWPMQKPSPQEIQYVQGLLADPRTHAVGVQEALKLRQKMTQPEPASIEIINKVPFYVAKDPTSGARLAMIPVPPEAMTQHLPGGSGGVPAGAQIDQDPLGNRTMVYKPPEGYQATPGGGLQYQQGGPADPMRPQLPAQGYQYQGPPGAPVQGAITGGPADPHAPINRSQGAQSIQKEIQPILTLAQDARTSVGAVRTGFQQGNGAGDIAMVNGLQHLIDKGVVRGEDVNMQMKSNGISGSIGSLTQYLQSGGLLTPEIRQAMLKTANELFANTDAQFKARVLGYRQTTDNQYGPGTFDQMVFPQETSQALGWNATAAPAPPAAAPPVQYPPGTRDAAIAEARKRGLLR